MKRVTGWLQGMKLVTAGCDWMEGNVELAVAQCGCDRMHCGKHVTGCDQIT